MARRLQGARTVSHAGSAQTRLAQWLMDQYKQRGLSYRKLASALAGDGYEGVTPYSHAQLARVTVRADLSWSLVHAFTVACEGDVEEARALWAQAAHAASALSQGRGMRPESINHHHELLKEMRRLRIQAGNPSLARLQSQARKAQRKLPKTTLGPVLAGQRLPKPQTLRAFLFACGVPQGTWEAWEMALGRCQEEQRRLRAQARQTRSLSPQLNSAR